MNNKFLVGGYGARGSNSYRAYLAFYPDNDAEYYDAGNFDALFSSLSEGICQTIVVPEYNTIIGSVSSAIKAKEKAREKGLALDLIGKIDISIHHGLITGPSGSLHSIKRVYSHEAALQQCLKTLSRLNFQAISHQDTYGAVVDVVKRNDPEEAALGPGYAAADLGGVLLKEDLSDAPDNSTTFYLYQK